MIAFSNTLLIDDNKKHVHSFFVHIRCFVLFKVALLFQASIDLGILFIILDLLCFLDYPDYFFLICTYYRDLQAKFYIKIFKNRIIHRPTYLPAFALKEI